MDKVTPKPNMENRKVRKPVRIQRRRTKGWRMPPNTVYVGRATIFGNPFPVGNKLWRSGFEVLVSPGMAVDLYKVYLKHRLILVSQIKDRLKGKNLACWCSLDQRCHADILLEVANEN